MDFQSPLYTAFLIRRRAKVLADAQFETGECAVVLCPNTTRMTGLARSGTEIRLSYRPKPGRRLCYVWETAVVNGAMVGVNLNRQRDLVAEAIENGVLHELGGYAEIRPAASRYLDLTLIPVENSGFPECQVAIAPLYVKNGADLVFPDGVEVANHHVLRRMEQALNDGQRAVLLLLAQRIDGIGVRAGWTRDAQYMTALRDLCDKGLEIICCGCSVSDQGIWLTARLPFMF